MPFTFDAHTKKNNIVYLHIYNHKYCFVAVRGDITRVPENVATKVRQRLTLPCAGNGSSIVDWEYLRWDLQREQPITYTGAVLDKYKERYSLNRDDGQFSLVIKPTALSDGGTYRCKDVLLVHEQHGDADVIVFGKTYFCYFSQNNHAINVVFVFS